MSPLRYASVDMTLAARTAGITSYLSSLLSTPHSILFLNVS